MVTCFSCQTVSLCWLDIRKKRLLQRWLTNGWFGFFFRCLLRIPCITYSINYFQQKIPNHLNQFLCRNPSTLSGFVVVLSLFFLLIYIQCLEFWLSIWQKSNKKQNEVFKSSLKTLDRLWDLTMCLKKQNKNKIDRWRKYALTAIWITAESCKTLNKYPRYIKKA